MDRSDVFISYRRTNVEFVKKLVNALQKSGREVWIDWEDIPPGSVGFSDDIRRGIEGADAFIAILSPDYLASEYCVDLELGYAVELNKRIIPIVYEKFDGTAQAHPVPASISHINWVYFVPHAGQANRFEESLPRVLNALDADHEYVKMHTTLITRAREWESRGHNPSFLLTGDAISAAEAWMSRGVNLKPAPSELQSNYIMESRAAATRRQRRFTAIAGVVAVILAILTVAAVFAALEANRQSQIAAQNEQEANIQRDLARQQERQARGLSIAARAELELNGNNPERSVLFGLEAVDLAYSVAAERALHRGVTENRLLHRYEDTGSIVNTLWSPDEDILVTNTIDVENNQLNVEVRDIETGELLIQQWNSYAAPLTNPNASEVHRFAVAGSGLLEIHDFDEERVIASTAIPNGTITNLLSSPDGQHLAVLTESGATVYRVDGLNEEGRFAGAIEFEWFQAEGETPGMVIQRPRNGDAVFNEILVYRLGEFAPQRTHFGTSASPSPDGRYLLVSNYNTESIDLWDLTSGSTQPLSSISGLNAFWSPAGRFFLSAAPDWGTYSLWDIETFDPANPAPVLSVEAIGADFSGGGEYVAFQVTRPTSTQPALHTIYDIDTLEEIYRFSGTLTYSPDETLFAESGVTDDRIRIRDAASGRLLFFIAGFRASPYWSPSGTLMALSDGENLSIWDASLSPSEFIFEGGYHTWSPDNTRLLTSRYPLLGLESALITREWDIATGREIAEVEGINPLWSPDNVHYATLLPAADAFDGSFSPADTLLHVSGGDDSAAPRSAPRRFEGRAPAFSFDGAYLSTAQVTDVGEPISITVHNVESGESLVTMRGEVARWSPSGEQLITSEGDASWAMGEARKSWLWDAAQPTILVEIEGSNATWSPDGRFFTTENRHTGPDGSTQIETLIWQRWDLQLNGRVRGALKAWSPDSSLAAVLNDEGLTLWDVNATGINGQVALTVADLDSGLFAFSPDGVKLAVSEQSNTMDSGVPSAYDISVYDVALGQVSAPFAISLNEGLTPALTAMIWSPDSTHLAVIMADEEVYAEELIILNVETGEIIIEEQAYSMSWSPNGQRAVSASRRGVATVWHIPLKEAMINIPLKAGGLYTVEWSPDGRFIVVTSDLDSVLWRFFQSTEDLITEAQRCCVLRELTEDERDSLGAAAISNAP